MHYRRVRVRLVVARQKSGDCGAGTGGAGRLGVSGTAREQAEAVGVMTLGKTAQAQQIMTAGKYLCLVGGTGNFSGGRICHKWTECLIDKFMRLEHLREAYYKRGNLSRS